MTTFCRRMRSSPYFPVPTSKQTMIDPLVIRMELMAAGN
jgi:hypothetical protein